jgi:hypothetical protein
MLVTFVFIVGLAKRDFNIVSESEGLEFEFQSHIFCCA